MATSEIKHLEHPLLIDSFTANRKEVILAHALPDSSFGYRVSFLYLCDTVVLLGTRNVEGTLSPRQTRKYCCENIMFPINVSLFA